MRGARGVPSTRFSAALSEFDNLLHGSIVVAVISTFECLSGSGWVFHKAIVFSSLEWVVDHAACRYRCLEAVCMQ